MVAGVLPGVVDALCGSGDGLEGEVPVDLEAVDMVAGALPGAWRRSSRGWAASTRLSAVGRERRNARASVADMVVRRRDPVMGIRQIQSAGSERWPGERGCGEGSRPYGLAQQSGAAQGDGQAAILDTGRNGMGRCFRFGRAEKSAQTGIGVGNPYVVERARWQPEGLTVIAGLVQVGQAPRVHERDEGAAGSAACGAGKIESDKTA